MADLTPVQVLPADIGILNFANIGSDSLAECNRLLDKNHRDHHMFVRDTAGHNHIVHAVLAVLALGGSPQELRDRYDDGASMQRPLPPCDAELLEKLNDPEVFMATLSERAQYTTFLTFFERKMAERGWRSVLQEYLFARTPLADAMLGRLYEGAYHALIHLGYGIEFQSPAIIAEALGQAASHDDSGIAQLFRSAEEEAVFQYPTPRGTPLIELVHEVRANDQIRTAPRWSDYGNKMRDGIVGRACEPMSTLASQFQIFPNEADLERRTAEMIGVCAYMSGAAQRPGRKRKIDFFHMHALNSALFFTVLIRQQWIRLEDRVRMVERKARLDLAWYAVAGSAALDATAITDYSSPESDGLGWDELFAAVNKEHDDGHAAKFIRALKNGEMVSRRYEQGEWAEFFPMKGDMWLKLARMCQDTTKGMPSDLKWIPFTGFEQPWKRADLAEAGETNTAEKVRLY
uniref:Baeyer-Villiger oxidase AgnL3 n=1 Tax=Paecilomyces divaricatus TaxID=644132 RepID=AGN3_PAEDI|nr:RecName: Full=Baeyer-Villiger oxidase AgnL3; AltName: Full=Agnestins biosynthesis cluster protein L3 [Paecilomyces divaricatus]QBG38885.1 Baeyer-Villiger monoxygenase [Paecilomyces divaricatus]